ncbi:MAG: Na-translocating system protein MpsC family protein [Solirubrobacteraceae bacterium]|nr:Na-translocating system protein MpsC family protein [Solirubrobacteraceae bacterium]
MSTGEFTPQRDPAPQRRDPLGNIARRIVQLQKEYSGKGPTKIRAHQNDDMVVVLMRDVYTTVEQTLAREGQEEAVLTQRHAFQQVMNERYIAVIEEETGRKVSAFMSTNHHDPDLSVEIFVFESDDEAATRLAAEEDPNT